MALTKDEKERIIDKYKLHDDDTGSPQVQIALMTARVEELTDHLSKHKKDTHSRRGLLQLVGKRRKLLKYLERTDEKAAKKLKKDLGLD